MTRIVAGIAGGRRLAVPAKGTRPTSDRVREALFSAVQSAVDLDGARVLDLYAGTGALGLEALSRGAESTLFVESASGALSVLRKNVAAVGLPGEVRAGKVAGVLAAGTPTPFDLVLADPPYVVEDLGLELRLLVSEGWLAPGALVIVERSRRAADLAWPEPLAPLKVRHYGETSLHWARA
ncbi:16S rRNA (guanine(966)-N(2))-methyltransferase RsmD [Actinophytocola oryzae]|uniref:16S rRNA (Guanine966-N2)-methyltransferase n=1 Tax=Actinophytocola oryzae TaxID=502181 RepID=A0A4R7UT58_9PSEU|nr:16S rRNA (guanine(966)-N(2))-methyltransferase RsmD [Actinophytocola oryzae]TDV39813.1 16S rRNA (guanine966-N2)-methyltransferase [Actinophytocola oryzae]